MKRVLSYSADTKSAAVRVYYASQDETEGNPDLSEYPMKMAIAASGGASEQSIRNWLKEDLSQEAIDDRLGHRGRSRVLSSDQELILIGFFIDKRLNLEPVSRKDLTDFARRYFGLVVYPQRISEILSKNGITLQASRRRGSRMVSTEVVNDAIDFISEVRDKNFSSSCVIVMDEVGLWSNVVNPKTYNFKNWCAIPSFSK